MVDVRNLQPGDKIRIVSEFDKDCLANEGGEMDIWLGKVLTVSQVLHDENTPEEFAWCVNCRETDSIDPFKRWYWYPAAIEEVVSEERLPEVNQEELFALYT